MTGRAARHALGRRQPAFDPRRRGAAPLAAGLPLPVSSFVGREQELAELERLLRATRLLTLVGAGGIGKTRLALELARRIEAAGGSDVGWVDLAPLAEPALLPAAFATTLGVREQPGRPLLDLLARAIGARRLLLMLDNCEQLIEPSAQLAGWLLEACPGLRILATSREPLRISGEVVWRAPPLSVPDRRTRTSAGEVAKAEAVQLFTERATAVRGDFALTEQNAGAIAELCQRLDGLPLALELAAARMAFVGSDQLARRLDDRFQLLARGSRSAPPRHQTLRAALDWSHELLSASERRLFARLSVFAAGWTLEAAEAVCADDPPTAADAIAARDVLRLLERLIDTSLVLAEPDGDGALRYRLLETVRAYARERLAAHGDAEPIAARHADFFLRLVEEGAKELRGGPNQVAWLARLEREYDQLRAALEWATSSGQAEVALRLAGGLWRFWWLHSHLSEGVVWLDTALAGRGGTASQRANALNGAGVLAHTRGDLDRAEAFFEQALELRREAGDLVGLAAALHNLGSIARERGDLDRAVVLCAESLALERRLGNTWGEAVSLNGLAKLAHARGELARAAELQEEGLRLARKIGDRRSVAIGLLNLAEITRDLGDDERAASLATQSLAVWDQLGDRWARATVLSDLARLAWLTGDQARALAQCIESLRLFQELESKQGVAVGLETLAGVLGATGRCEAGARILGAAGALREAVGSPVTTTERRTHAAIVEAVRAGADRAGFARAWAAGRCLEMAEALRYALDEVAESAAARAGASDPAALPPGLAALTGREREVLGLLARGQTNREIADRLVIGVRTVETHVSHILRKLELDSRGRAMVWAREHAAGDP